MAKQEFNLSPYFDDFDPTKNFYRVLFKPSVPIQTRELNQLQSILAYQTESIGNHLFKFGSMVKSGRPKYTQYVNYVRLKDLAVDGTDIDVSRFVGKTLLSETSGISAEVIHIEPKDEFDPATIFVTYTNSAIDAETSAFIDGEIVNVLDDSGYPTYQATVRCPNCEVDGDVDSPPINPTGFGSLFSNVDTSYYVYGNVVDVEDKIITLSKYTTTASNIIGYQIIQSLVTAGDDQSLFDNAIGSPNYTAPGADRFRIKLNLVKKPVTDEDTENFVFVAKVESGYLTKIFDVPQYADLMETMARRTYDESGNYTVTPFKIQFKNHLKIDPTDNTGVVLAEDGGDPNKFAVMLSSGKAYVRGREIPVIAESFVVGDKARDGETKYSNAIRPTLGNYITVTIDPNYGALPNTNIDITGDIVNDFTSISFYDAASGGGSNAGVNIGSAKAKAFVMQSGTVGLAENDLNTAIYQLHIFDVVMGAGKTMNDVRGFLKTDGAGSFYGNVVEDPIETGVRKIYNPIENKLFYKLPNTHITSIRDGDNPLAYSAQITTKKKLVGAVAANGFVTFASGANEVFKSYNALTWICGKKVTAENNYKPYDLTGNITSSPSLITIDATGFVGHSIVLTCEVLRTSAKEKVKTYQSNGSLSAEDGVQEIISLGKPDVYKVKTIFDVTGGAPGVDVTEHYTLQKNIKDNYYNISTIKRNATYAEPAPGALYDITFDYFEHSGNGYFFSVDSYLNIINDPNIDFDYEDLGTYTSNDGTIYNVSDIIDFRQTKDLTGGFDTATGAIVSNLPVNNSDIILDVNYFLPRIDALVLNDNGDFINIKGVPSLTPHPPKTPDNAMKLYHIILDAYTFDIKTDIKKDYFDNRRYTMADIGKLNTRIENLEYYVTFNMLEKSTADLQILDENGNTRFKNGFLTDMFKDYIGSATNSGEYRCSLDTEVGELRPSFHANGINLAMNESASSHYTKLDEVVTLPYEHVEFITQPFASKSVSVNPYFIYNMIGDLRLSPETDVWNDQTRDPDIVVNIDTGFDALREVASAAGVLGTSWNSWNATGSTSTRVGRTRTTVTTQTRSGVNNTIEESITTSDLGDAITSVNLVAYMRDTTIQFSVSGLLPRTRVYPFFDDVDVSEFCRVTNKANGSPIITEDDGTLVGVFNVPAGKFFVGDRTFRLTNMENNSKDPDELTTSAEKVFYSAGMESTIRNTSLSVSTPEFTSTDLSEERVLMERRRVGGDPIAQSFKIEDTPTGCFLTKIDVYFNAKHARIPAWLEIRTMVNGYPSEIVLGYAKVVINPDDVTVSTDSTAATTLEFKAPVFVENDTEYCVVIGSTSRSWRCFVSKLGGSDIATSNEFTQNIISEQPSLGTFFKSQNGATWTAEQLDDLKFRLHKAKFDVSNDLSIVAENTAYDQRVALTDNPFETEIGTNVVRVFHKKHGLVPLDKVKLEMHSDTWHEVALISGKLIVGQTITGTIGGATAIISEIQENTSTSFKIKISDLVGAFPAGENFQSNSYGEPYESVRLLTAQGIVRNVVINSPASGSFVLGIDTAVHGIPMTELSTPSHIIQEVDTFDSYIIHTASNATETGRVGSEGHKAIGNVQVDTMMLNINYLLFGGTETWNLDSMSHSGIGGTGTNYQPNAAFPIVPNQNIDLENTAKVASELNEFSFYGNNKSIVITGNLGSLNENVSPVINLDTLNYIAITNRIDANTDVITNIAPNAADRWVTELDVAVGSNEAKYITVPINLETSATRIKLYVDALNFLYSNIDVYYRTLAVESDDVISDQNWVLARSITEAFSETDTDFREVEVNAPLDEIDLLPEFKSFQIKFVLRSTKSSKPPKLKRLRAIAVT